MMIKISRKLSKCWLFSISLTPLIWLSYALYSDTALGTKLMTADPIQKLDRELGDWALIFIILTLAVRPLADILQRKELVAYRRMVGLFAFFYVCVLCSFVLLSYEYDYFW